MSLSCFGVCELVGVHAHGRGGARPHTHTPQAFSLVSEGYTLRTSLGGRREDEETNGRVMLAA